MSTDVAELVVWLDEGLSEPFLCSMRRREAALNDRNDLIEGEDLIEAELAASAAGVLAALDGAEMGLQFR